MIIVISEFSFLLKLWQNANVNLLIFFKLIGNLYETYNVEVFIDSIILNYIFMSQL